MFISVSYLDDVVRNGNTIIRYRVIDSCFKVAVVSVIFKSATPPNTNSPYMLARAIIAAYRLKKRNVAKHVADFFLAISKSNKDKALELFENFICGKNAERVCNQFKLKRLPFKTSVYRYINLFKKRHDTKKISSRGFISAEQHYSH